MLLLTVANVLYVLISIAMIILILLQRGAGAQAGSGFGAGASATVFGSRGASNFLSKSTGVLATLFFAISLGMAVYSSRSADPAVATDDLGVMGALAPSEVPSASTSTEIPSPATDGSAADALPLGDAKIETPPIATGADPATAGDAKAVLQPVAAPTAAALPADEAAVEEKTTPR